jgi:hypothetical protein
VGIAAAAGAFVLAGGCGRAWAGAGIGAGGHGGCGNECGHGGCEVCLSIAVCVEAGVSGCFGGCGCCGCWEDDGWDAGACAEVWMNA